MNREAGCNIGSTVGTVEQVDVNSKGVGWGKYLRVKVMLDITKPLARGRLLKIKGK
jgi:hypothetical protein